MKKQLILLMIVALFASITVDVVAQVTIADAAKARQQDRSTPVRCIRR